MKNSTSNQLSPGARALLEQITSDLESQIVAEAERLNPGDILTARDINDGFRTVQLQQRDAEGSAYRFAQRLRWSRILVIYSAAAGIAALIASVVAVLGSFSEVRSSYIDVTVAAFALLAAALMVSIVLLAARESRISRMRALRDAEVARESHRALEIAVESAREAIDGLSNDGELLLPRFIAQWARLEDRLRRLAQVALGMPADVSADYPIGGLLRDLIRVGVLDAKSGEDLQDVLDVRNLVAHGRIVSTTDLSVGVRLMERLEVFLDDNITERTLS